MADDTYLSNLGVYFVNNFQNFFQPSTIERLDGFTELLLLLEGKGLVIFMPRFPLLLDCPSTTPGLAICWLGWFRYR
jgi:hypothetical protein